MKVWLIQRSEPTPHDNNGIQRLMRMGILAQMLVALGHRTLWWTSTFDHYSRHHRYENDVRVPVEEGYAIQYLHGCGYSQNISLSRFRDNYLVAKKFSDLADKDHDPPDVILASIPTAELGLAAVNYAQRRNIPTIIDVRDLWPDVFFDLVPKVLWPAVSIFSVPMVHKLKSACKGASGIIGPTDAFVKWGVAHAGRLMSDNDRVFPMGYLADNIPAARIEEGERFWQERGVNSENKELLVIFLGSFGTGFDFVPLFHAVKLLECKNVPIKVIICGAGENAEELKRQAQGFSNILFPGWINAEQIRALLKFADVGIAPYIESVNYINNIPNKPAEYLSGGLAIALSLNKGALYELVMQNHCGFSYDNEPEKLATELEFLVKNKERLKTFQLNALKTFNESFDGLVVYKRLIEFLEKMSKKDNYSVSKNDKREFL